MASAASTAATRSTSGVSGRSSVSGATSSRTRRYSEPTPRPGFKGFRNSSPWAPQISSIATSTFADNMIVQNAFAANLISNRDIGITVLSDEDQYKLNYAIGIWNGAGTNLSREGTSVSQAVPASAVGSNSATVRRTYNYNTRFLTGEMMYTARVLYKFSGNPGYGQGDILESRVPQVALAFGYAYNPGTSTWEEDGYQTCVLGIFEERGKLLVFVNHNTDLMDASEWADDPLYPQKLSKYSYKIVSNAVVYALSH